MKTALTLLKIGLQVAKNYKRIVPELQDLYKSYHDAIADKRLSLAETRQIAEDVFDLVALLIPAFADFKAMKTATKK